MIIEVLYCTTFVNCAYYEMCKVLRSYFITTVLSTPKAVLKKLQVGQFQSWIRYAHVTVGVACLYERTISKMSAIANNRRNWTRIYMIMELTLQNHIAE